jgi:hypothetical protein
VLESGFSDMSRYLQAGRILIPLNLRNHLPLSFGTLKNIPLPRD